MGTVAKLNDVLCANISKVDDRDKTKTPNDRGIYKWDDNVFCPFVSTPTPTPTPTITPTSTPPSVTPTPTPTPATCLEGHVPKDTDYEYKDCCYPYLQISGNSGPATEGLFVCFNTTGYRSPSITVVSPIAACDTSILTTCCEIELGYDELDLSVACGASKTTYYISIPCKSNGCILDYALGIYTDVSCTTLAPDGFYSDGTVYGEVSGGIFTFSIYLCP